MIASSQNRNKIVLIIGASRGIGKELAFQFGRREYSVLLAGRNTEHLETNCNTINESGGKAAFIKCDVTNIEEIRSAIEFTKTTFGRLDIAILNAGIGISTRFSDFDRNAFDNVLNTNFIGVINAMELLVPVMKEQGSGTIVGIGSLIDTRAIPGSSPYIASKAALNIVLEAAAIELKPFNINVITVRPGFVATDLTADNTFGMPMLITSERAAKKIINGILKNRPNIYFPLPMAILSFISKIIPPFIWRFIFRITN